MSFSSKTQVQKKEQVGRSAIDNLEAVMIREEGESGFIHGLRFHRRRSLWESTDLVAKKDARLNRLRVRENPGRRDSGKPGLKACGWRSSSWKRIFKETRRVLLFSLEEELCLD
jgi:hypothetical protein